MAATPAEFTAVAVARLRQLIPPPEVRVVEELVLEVTRPGTEPAILRLQNLWWAHLAAPEQLRSRLDQLAAHVQEVHSGFSEELESVKQRIRAVAEDAANTAKDETEATPSLADAERRQQQVRQQVRKARFRRREGRRGSCGVAAVRG